MIFLDYFKGEGLINSFLNLMLFAMLKVPLMIMLKIMFFRIMLKFAKIFRVSHKMYCITVCKVLKTIDHWYIVLVYNTTCV